MISICIPIYNQEISNLINELTNQIRSLSLNIEIIVIDDGSEDVFENQNLLKDHTYIALQENVGRSKIRNLFVEHAKHDNLLFLDGDVVIVGEDFVENYINVIRAKSFDVICGGLLYSDTVPLKTHQLRWRYGIKRECRSVEKRTQSPYNSFMTSNFVIKKEGLIHLPFDEQLTDYGHEDTLMGFELKKTNKAIIHIQNPVLHADHTSNEAFIYKTEKAIQNLFYIHQTQKYQKEFSQSIKLLRLAKILKTLSLTFGVLILFKVVKLTLKKGLISGDIKSLNSYDFYKLGVFLEQEKNRFKLS